ncbi:MAG: metalloprotease PmbA [Stagnimonas sp.]|nr:metalloprotease PmbA [Stagnimonas sp.]
MSQLPDPAVLETCAARALEAAQRAGATQAETNVSTSRALTVNVRKGEVESVEFQKDRDLSITVYFGHRMGSASTADLSDAGIAATVAAACDIARAAGEDVCLGLADASRMTQTPAGGFADLSLVHPWLLTPDTAADLACAAEAAAFAADPRVTQSEGAGADTREGLSVYANTHGFVGHRRSTDHSLSCAVIAKAGDKMQNGHYYTSSRDHTALLTPAFIGREAGLRAAARLGARSLTTRTAPVLFTPEVARGLISHFLSGISGGALYRKASFLLDKVGTPVFASHLNIHQRPHLKGAAASAWFDGEGVAVQDRTLIDGGMLTGYLLGSYAARRLGLESTGNAGGAFNIVVEPGAHDHAALRQQMGTGLLVTSLMGQGVNMVTGDYSRGAEGFWIENGEIVHPVEEVTIAGNLAQMFRSLVAVGNDVDTRGMVRCGSLLLAPMTVAGS